MSRRMRREGRQEGSQEKNLQEFPTGKVCSRSPIAESSVEKWALTELESGLGGQKVGTGWGALVRGQTRVPVQCF